MRSIWQLLLVVCSFVFFLPFALAQGRPTIESIEGDKIVVVITATGNRVGSAGTKIDFGDRIKTGPYASAKIRYPDGSKLLIGRATEMEVQENASGTQFNQIHSGEVRGIIKKPKALQSMPQTTAPRFVIRSKAAVMGVRGTDFVYNLQEEAAKAQIHTLDGTVEVAKDEAALMKGEGIPVRKDQFITADQNKVYVPEKFDREAYMKNLVQSEPEFVELIKNDPDAVSDDENLQPEPEKPLPRWRLLVFQVNAMAVKQSGENPGSVYTTEISFNPWIRVFGPFGLRGHFGVFPLKGKLKGDRFTAIEGGVLATLTLFNKVFAEVGPGSQVWLGERSSNNGMILINAGWKFSDYGFIERVFVGVGHYQQNYRGVSNNGMSITTYQRSVDEFKVGIGFHF